VQCVWQGLVRSQWFHEVVLQALADQDAPHRRQFGPRWDEDKLALLGTELQSFAGVSGRRVPAS
jgi:hypothetical protein